MSKQALTNEEIRAILAAGNYPKQRCYHERVLGKHGWTCVGCGDTVDSLPKGECPYDTSGDF